MGMMTTNVIMCIIKYENASKIYVPPSCVWSLSIHKYLILYTTIACNHHFYHFHLKFSCIFCAY